MPGEWGRTKVTRRYLDGSQEVIDEGTGEVLVSVSASPASTSAESSAGAQAGADADGDEGSERRAENELTARQLLPAG
jgi:hypothetical protein